MCKQRKIIKLTPYSTCLTLRGRNRRHERARVYHYYVALDSDVKSNRVTVIRKFLHKNNKYSIFKVTKNISLTLNPDHFYILNVRPKGLYLFATAPAFGKTPFQLEGSNRDLYMMVESMYHDRTSFHNGISSSLFTELSDTKLEYTDFLQREELTQNSEVVFQECSKKKLYSLLRSQYVIKFPLTSGDAGVLLPSHASTSRKKLPLHIWREDGHIQQIIHRTILTSEMRLHVVNGRIEYFLINTRDGWLIFNKKFKCLNRSPELEKAALFGLDEHRNKITDYFAHVSSYATEVKQLCSSIHKLLNKMINVRLHKMRREMELFYEISEELFGVRLEKFNHRKRNNILNKLYKTFVPPDVSAEAVMTSILRSVRLRFLTRLKAHYKAIDRIKVKQLEDLINTSLHTYMLDNQSRFSTKIHDFYFRVDVALPDGHKYKNLSVNEVESFANNLRISCDVMKKLKLLQWNSYRCSLSGNDYFVSRIVEDSFDKMTSIEAFQL